MKCKECDGLGLLDCGQCKGEGFDYGTHKCEGCAGDGRIACVSCSGSGKISILDRIKK